MQVGDIVKHFLTEQIGIVLEVRKGTKVALSAANDFSGALRSLE